MKSVSPLRYPGGKSAMTGLLGDIRTINGVQDRDIAEPFAGGAGASLLMLYREETQEIYVNDADPAIHDFWWSVVNRCDVFSEMISKTRVTMSEWRRQREIYRSAKRVSRLNRGFAAFYLNRCNRSGIIMNGGPIGGIEQNGEWKLNARFNKTDLKLRCEKIAQYRKRLKVSCKDGLQFIREIDTEKTFLFIDPPYYGKGKTLYMNSLDEQYHLALAAQLKRMEDTAWVLTYDDCEEVRRLYGGWATVRPFSLRYVASKRRNGNEVLITPKWMTLPESQSSLAITW